MLIKWQCFLKLIKRRKRKKNDVKKMKIGLWVKQCLDALFECQEHVNEITKNHTKAVSGEFCVISVVLRKIDFRGYVTF